MAEADEGAQSGAPDDENQAPEGPATGSGRKPDVWIEVTLGGQGAFRAATKLTTSKGTVLNRTRAKVPPKEAERYVDQELAKYVKGP